MMLMNCLHFIYDLSNLGGHPRDPRRRKRGDMTSEEEELCYTEEKNCCEGGERRLAEKKIAGAREKRRPESPYKRLKFKR